MVQRAAQRIMKEATSIIYQKQEHNLTDSEEEVEKPLIVYRPSLLKSKFRDDRRYLKSLRRQQRESFMKLKTLKQSNIQML
jgi:hypothetical protein